MTEVSTVKLGDVWAIKSGAVDPSKFPEEVFDLYSIPAFDHGKPEVVAGKRIGSTKQTVQPGDVLLSKIVPHIRRSWVVGPYRGRRIVASSEWIVFRGDRIHPQYLRHVLVGDPFHAQLMLTVSGVGGSLLRARPAHVAKIRVPCPPLAEQRRIAAILDKADALQAKRRAALGHLGTLAQSIFFEMFGDPIRNPKSWEDRITLGQVADIVSGVTKGRKTNGKPTRIVPYLAVANVQDQSLNLTSVKSIEATEDEIAGYRLQRNDLLMTEGGDPDKLGRGTLWNGEIAECIHQNHIFRVRLRREASLDAQFLTCLVSGARGKKYFLASAKQTTGIASINLTQLRNFPLLMPPIALQREFVARKQALELLAEKQKRALSEIGALFASLQRRAFRGEL